MAKHIGIVGCSAEGAALCYQTICWEGVTKIMLSSAGKLKHTIPTDSVRERIDSIIFNELVYGEIRDDSKKYFHTQIKILADKGCDTQDSHHICAAVSCTDSCRDCSRV